MEGGEIGKQKGKEEEERDGEGNRAAGSKHPTQLQEECVSTNRKTPESDGKGVECAGGNSPGESLPAAGDPQTPHQCSQLAHTITL